jgi:hypothetical protein
MRTNREKYDLYLSLMKTKDAAAIAKLFPNGVPSQFYGVGHYTLRVFDVLSVSRYRAGFYERGPDSRVTSSDVAAVTKYANEWTPPKDDEVLVHYQYSETHGRVQGAYSIKKITPSEGMAWKAEDLEAEIQRRKALYEPREGHQPCQYCGKQQPIDSLVSGTVTYRSHGGLQTKKGMYCSSACASHDQMGHEG